MALDELWYHDFSVLGFPTPQRPGIFAANQEAKQGPMFRLIDEALRRHPGDVVELFCADALFGIYALQNGARSLLGIDIGSRATGGRSVHLEQARVAADALHVGDRATFQDMDVWDLKGSFEIGICAGGLYHLPNPEKLLVQLRGQISGALVVQTVVSLENTADDYFEIATPFRPLGSSCSAGWMVNAVARAGWTVAMRLENELTGNPELYNRGSLYLLLE
jgi:hypothetical protein